ncbi:MAG: 2,4-dienoyl-CoA reductase, partial [Allobaculum sp.]|nr:2,4-dienoyl-CoA reductase [Allobaculum sp.]
VKQYVRTALQEVKENAFVVKTPDGEIKEIPFDLGFNCLGMRSNNPVLEQIKETFEPEGVYVYPIGDSIRARRIIEGTMEGRAILNVLESEGYLDMDPISELK